MQNKIGFYISSVLVGLMLISSMLFVVDQRQFGVVYSFGQIQSVITEPGLNFKLPPPFQNVNYIDKRLLTLDNADTEPMLTAEKQRMVIDWYVRWRITEPSQYIRNVGIDENTGAVQLARVVRNAFQEEINKRTVKELLASSSLTVRLLISSWNALRTTRASCTAPVFSSMPTLRMYCEGSVMRQRTYQSITMRCFSAVSMGSVSALSSVSKRLSM